MAANGENVVLLVGTHKGGFLFTSDRNRKEWEMKGPFFRGTDVHYMNLDARRSPTIHACVNSAWWGPGVRRSLDWGETWEEPESAIRFEEEEDRKVARVWCVVPGPESAPQALYAGVDPAALFRSQDGGATWSEVKGLASHSTRDRWSPGAGGLMVHSICPHPERAECLHVGISAAGTFATEDSGQTWETRNQGVRADYLPEKYPEVGQCVHHLKIHPSKPDVLYQQGHDGVYRSDDGGRQWVDVSEGLPSRFGFPLQIHPHDPDTIYVVPEEGAEFRCPPNAELAVYRSRNRGEAWEKLNRGLPSRNAFLNIYRQALTADHLDPCGLYMGTSTGQIFQSRDEGESWELLANWLPPVFCVRAATI